MEAVAQAAQVGRVEPLEGRQLSQESHLGIHKPAAECPAEWSVGTAGSVHISWLAQLLS